MSDPRDLKVIKSPDYNMVFNMKSGHMARWGATPEADPEWCPFGPEIADIEISTGGCPGTGGGRVCAFCYKGNTSAPAYNMSLKTFMSIIDKFPPTLCQVALGITGAQTNPDLISMLKYCRMKKIIPNYTLTGADLTDEILRASVDLCGAISVSCYPGALDLCFDTVLKFVESGMAQTNIHFMLSAETLQYFPRIIDAVKNDSRLRGLNALVFLSLKPKGRAKDGFQSVTDEHFYMLVDRCLKDDIMFGFDSCAGHRLISVLDKFEGLSQAKKDEMIQSVEPCESSLFSTYINAKGECWHCSFAENEPGVECVDLTTVRDFKDAWEAKQTRVFRERLLANGRRCPVWNV